jgi:hypothetical protein
VPERAEQLYFEDVVLHGEIETPALTLTAAHVQLYAGLTQEPVGDGDIVPDYLPLCVTTGLGWRAPQPPLVVTAFVGFEWSLHGPVRIGDTIRSRSRTVTKRRLRDGGLIVEERDLINQRGDIVERGRLTFLVACRPSPDGTARDGDD